MNNTALLLKNKKEIALNKLFTMKFNPNKPITTFVDYFNELRSKSNMEDIDTLKRCLLNPLPSELFKFTHININQNKCTTIEQIIQEMVSTYHVLNKDVNRHHKHQNSNTQNGSSSH